MSSLSLEAIQELLAGARTKGDYDEALTEFLNGGEAGIEVDLENGVLAGKDSKNVVTGFNNARIRMNKETGQPRHPGGHAVKVIRRTVKDENGNETGAHVFLINTAKLGEGAATAEQSAEAATA